MRTSIFDRAISPEIVPARTQTVMASVESGAWYCLLSLSTMQPRLFRHTPTARHKWPMRIHYGSVPLAETPRMLGGFRGHGRLARDL